MSPPRGSLLKFLLALFVVVVVIVVRRHIVVTHRLVAHTRIGPMRASEKLGECEQPDAEHLFIGFDARVVSLITIERRDVVKFAVQSSQQPHREAKLLYPRNSLRGCKCCANLANRQFIARKLDAFPNELERLQQRGTATFSVMETLLACGVFSAVASSEKWCAY